MAEIGKATLTIVPKLPGLDAAVRGAFARVDASSIGEQAGRSYSGGIMRTGAVAGAFAAVTQKAIGAVTSHIGAAISRFDIMNNYPRVMESLGYSAEAADASIGKMSDRLQGLPTALDSMVSTVQGISAITGDLDKATDAGLALNDMLLAGGASTQASASAMEQFRQMLSKGKPEMEDWRSLTSAAPGQMAQLAKAMLGPTANANDLYAALGGGKNDPTITMDQLMDAMIRLDAEGGDAIKSFSEQAREATGGVATSMENVGTAITRGLASTLDAIGKDNIAGAFNDIRGAVNDVFNGVNGAVTAAMPAIKGLYGAIKELGPAILAGGAALTVFNAGAKRTQSALGGLSGRFSEGSKMSAKFAGAAKAVGRAGGIISAGLGIGTFAVAAIAGAIEDARRKEENFQKSTTGLMDAVANAAALDAYAGKVDGVGQAAGISAKSVDELAESGAKMADAMAERNAEAQGTIGMLNSARQVVHDYAGATDLSTEANGRLEWAVRYLNEQLGLNISKNDVLSGTYTDQDGNVRNLTEDIDKLIDARKREIEMGVLEQDYEDAYKQWRDAEKTRAEEHGKVDWDRARELEGLIDSAAKEGNQTALASYTTELDNMTKSYDKAREESDAAAAAMGRAQEAMGLGGEAAGEAADEWAQWGDRMSESSMRFAADAHGGFANLVEDMRNLGVHTEALADLSPEALMDIGEAYDGTELSLVKALSGIDGALDESVLATYQAALSIRDALTSMNVAGALGDAGMNIDDFALACERAGISTEKLGRIGGDSLREMARQSGGSMEELLRLISEWEETPVDDKDIRITVDGGELVDAQGRAYEWNGTALVSKETGAKVDYAELVDAQGNVYEWNGTELVEKSSSAKVEYGTVLGARDAIADYNRNPPQNFEATTTLTTVTRTISETVDRVLGPRAAGGIRPNAAGGMRMHAAGAIARSAVPLDIVGEAGAEAIVPLTNRRYSQPFADIIAEGVTERMGGGAGGPTNIYINLDYSAGADAKDITRGIARQLELHGLMRG